MLIVLVGLHYCTIYFVFNEHYAILLVINFR